ncbi:MAG TPA: hypothetical protein VMZ30_07925, partial [Pyrinomonadaceae bacterium]|nr:hypothetical protein [Pyrinomonadaceae bacterium]
RVDHLYSQISPELELKESAVEKSTEANRKIEGGAKDIIKSERAESEGEKKTEQYKAKEVTPHLMAIALLNFFSDKKSMQEFETLELSSDELRKLDDFNTISQSYGISYDKKRYDSIYTEIIKKTVIEQQEKLRGLEAQIVIKGTFNIEHTTNIIVLTHSYFDKNNVRIVFVLDPIPEDSPSIKSSSLKNRDLNGKAIAINAFAKVIRIESQDSELAIHCETYAIW